MSETKPDAARVPVVFVTDLSLGETDPADLFDLAFLIRDSRYQLVGIVAPGDGAGRVLDAFFNAADADSPPRVSTRGALIALLETLSTPVNLIAAGAFVLIDETLRAAAELFRSRIARLFLVGGHANDYGSDRLERIPIDPRLSERHAARFLASGDPRLGEAETAALLKLLVCGEAVIWLPRDICLWRYFAPGLLENGDRLADFLRREAFFANLSTSPDRFAAADESVLLSSLPALCLAAHPDPFLWLRLFRVGSAKVETSPDEKIISIDIKSPTPNAFVVQAIDSAALTKLMTATIRRAGAGA